MNNSTRTILAILAVVILGGAAVYAATQLGATPTPTATSTATSTTTGTTDNSGTIGGTVVNSTTTTTTTTVVGGTAGAHCGGFIQNAPTCAAGFHCQLATSRPDTGGTCVADASGIRGVVTLGPTCPVQQNPPQPQCADKPYQTTVSVSRSGYTAVYASTQSAADGTFTLSLPPGTYTVTAKGGATLPRCASVTAKVGSTGYAVTNISCDTGIR